MVLIYSEVPQNLTVQHAGVLLSGMTAYEVTANAGSFIAMTANGEILGTAQGTGTPVSITIPAQLPGTIVNITITKDNYYRYAESIQVIPPSGAYIIKDVNWVNDTLLGNGNGLLDYNESVNLSLGMKNVGSAEANNIQVTLSTTDTYVTIIDGNENFGNIPAASEVIIANAFAFSAAGNVPDGHSILFAITATDGTDTWTSSLSVDANAPELTIGNMIVSDPLGNNNGRLDPGETADLIISATNTGNSISQDALATLGSVSSYITVNNGSASLGNMVPGTPVSATFNITVDAATPIGTVVNFDYAVEAGAYGAVKSFVSKIGLILEDFESGGFTHFAWTQGGNQPWTITNVDPFEGTFSAKSGTIAASQKSDLILQMNVTNADSISFYLKTSSESGYDYLKFFIDATMAAQWAGETGWTRAAFPVTAGNHTFKWEYMKDGSVTSGSDCSWLDYIIFPAAAPAAASVTGAVTYANTANTPLAGLTIQLKNSGGNVVATSTTNATGNYTFSAVAPGSYTLAVITTKPWGGVSAADVLLYRKHIANITLLSGIYLASGDVNASGGLTAADVLLIKKRIANITTSFSVGDWLFNNTPFTVTGGSVTQNFKGITYGDANGSFTPTANKSLETKHQGVMTIGSAAAFNGPVTVPVHVSDIRDMGAFQFTIQYDPEKFTFEDVTSWYAGIDAVTVGTPAPGFITFVWAADVAGISINDGVLCNLHFMSNSTDGSVVSFAGNPTQIEFTEYDGTAFEPVFINGAVGSPTGIDAMDQTAFSIYPNPVSNQATISYTIQSDCDVTLSVFNAMGQEIKVLASVAGQNAGAYRVKFDGTGLNAGVYYCKLKLNSNTLVKKIVLTR